MTRAEVDRALARWNTDLEKITANLLDLQGLVVYDSARGKELHGLTRERAQPALRAVDKLWEHLALLKAVIARATVARAALPSFGQGKALAEITEILEGPSIELGVVDIPVDERALLDERARVERTTPAALAAAMTASFAEAKATLLALQDAWKVTADFVASLEAEAAALVAEALRQGALVPPEVETLRTELAALRVQQSSDPLGLREACAATAVLEPAREHAKKSVAAIGAARARLASDLRAVQDTLAELQARRVKALELYQKCVSQIRDPAGLDVPPSLRALERRLPGLVAIEPWTAAATAVGEWLRDAAAVRAAIESAVDTNRALDRKRQELVKRWTDAKTASDQHRAQGGKIGRALSTFAAQAEAALAGKVDLSAAESAIHAFETRLAEDSAHRR